MKATRSELVNIKRLVRYSAILMMLFSLLATPKTVKAESIGFEIKGGVLIDYYGNEKEIVIPDTVTVIGENAFVKRYYITSVTMPDSVKKIEADAFFKCEYLQTVELSNSLTSIGNGAFMNCSSLTEISIPDTVDSIGAYAFSECTKLEKVTYSGSLAGVGAGAFAKTLWLSKQQKQSPLVILGNILIDGKKCTGAVDIPDEVKIIGDGAFENNTKITGISIPSSVISIGISAFNDCKGLTKLTIPTSVTDIGALAFSGCSKLSSITIPSSVTYIGHYTFQNTPWLKAKVKKNPLVIVNDIVIDGTHCKGKVTVPKPVNLIADRAFERAVGVTSVSLPDTVTVIGNQAFVAMSNLKKINIPKSVVSIGDNAFEACNSLKSIVIPKSVKSIGAMAFYECLSLTTVDNNSSITQIETQTFQNCTSLTKVSIPKTVKNIGNYAFYGCVKLTAIVLPGSLKSIEDSAFSSCESLKKVTIPKSVTYFGKYVFDNTPWLVNQKDALVIINHIIIDGRRAKGKVIIPKTVTGIAAGAFTASGISNENLTEIQIPDSVTSIGSFAFSYCSNLKKVSLPKSLTVIENYTFSQCDSLSSIVIPDSITRLGNGAFSSCSSLKKIDIPVSVLRLGDLCFASCTDLMEVNMYREVIDWGYNSFCDNHKDMKLKYFCIHNKRSDINVGRTFYLKIAINDMEDNVVWSVSDETIASIDSKTHILTAKKPGTITITATIGRFQDSFELKVNAVDRFVLKGKKELVVGEASDYRIKNLEDEELDDYLFLWKVSDESIAVVDNRGVLTPIKEGAVTVTVTAGNISGSFDVKVIKNPKDTLKITGRSEMIVGEAGVYQIEGLNAKEKVTWSVSDYDKAEFTDDYIPVLDLLSMGTGTFVLFADTKTAHGELTITVKPIEIMGNPNFSVNQDVTFSVNANKGFGGYWWHISDYEIAFIDDEYADQAEVSGAKEGTAILSVENLYNGASASIEIHVGPQAIDILEDQ